MTETPQHNGKKKRQMLQESQTPQYKTPRSNSSNTTNNRRKTRSQKRTNKKRKCPPSTSSSLEPSAKKQKRQAKKVREKKELGAGFPYISIQLRKDGNCFLGARNLWVGNKRKNYEKNMNGFPIMAQILRVLYCVKYLPTELNWQNIKEISNGNSESKAKLDFKCIAPGVTQFIHKYNHVVKLIPAHFRCTTYQGHAKKTKKDDDKKTDGDKKTDEEKDDEEFLDKYETLLKHYMSKYKFPTLFKGPAHWYGEDFCIKTEFATFSDDNDEEGKEKENLIKLEPKIVDAGANATPGTDSQDSTDSDDDFILFMQTKRDARARGNSQDSDTSTEYGQSYPGSDHDENLKDQILVLQNEVKKMTKRIAQKTSALHNMSGLVRRKELENQRLKKDKEVLVKQNEKQEKQLTVKRIEAGVYDVPKMVKYFVEHWEREQVSTFISKIDKQRKFVGCGAVLIEGNKYKKLLFEKLEKDQRQQINDAHNKIIVAAQIFGGRFNSRQIQEIRNITVNEIQCKTG